MSKITENFRLEEFACKDGSEFPQSVLKNIIILAKQLQELRNYTGKSITVNSGYRSTKYNAKVGGVENSQHILGTASDIQVKGMTPKQVAEAIELLISQGKMKEGGIGIYKTFTHYDIRGKKARW